MLKIIEGFKKIREDLKAYQNYYKVRFWTFKRVNRILLEVLKRTKWLYIIILILGFVIYRPRNHLPGNNFIEISQIILFVLLCLLVYNTMLVFYRYFTDEYHHEFQSSGRYFEKITKVITIVLTILFIVLIGNTQLYVNKHYLSPPLETCSYYDWYGNVIYESKDYKTCTKLRNVEINGEPFGDDNRIQFGVLNESKNEYYKYLYQYTNQQLTYRLKETYILTNEQEDYLASDEKQKVSLSHLKESNELINTYQENEFTSIERTKEFNENRLYRMFERQVSSELNQDQNIKVQLIDTIKTIPKDQEPTVNTSTSEYLLLRNNLYRKLEIEKDSQFIYEKVGTFITESYYGYDNISFSRIYTDYIINKTVIYQIRPVDREGLNTIALPMIKGINYRYGDHLIEYKPYIKERSIKVSYIDQLEEDELTYKHLIHYTEYGFKVEHYNYKRDRLKRFELTNDTKSSCYQNAHDQNLFDYNYYYAIDFPHTTCVGREIFYKENPLLLNPIQKLYSDIEY